jgi:membrane protein implicated in regulation of membrane protease activity
MDILNYIYWISFVVGTGYVLFAGVMGMAGGFDTESGDVGFDAHDFDMDADVEGDFDIDGGMEAESLEHEHDAQHHGVLNKDYGESLAHAGGHSPDLANFNPFSIVSIASFLAAFGGGGLLAGNNGAGLAISLLAAMLAGTVMAVFFWLVVGKWLFSMQGTSQARQADMIGLEAEVITPLSHDKTGEIAYIMRGTRFTAPARLDSEGEVGRNEKVRIRIKRDNTVYVERRRSLLE